MALLLASAAKAETVLDASHNAVAFADTLKGYASSLDVDSLARNLKTLFDYKGDFPADGTVPLTKTFPGSDTTTSCSMGCTTTTTTAANAMNVRLVMKNGKIAGMTATLRSSGISNSENTPSTGGQPTKMSSKFDSGTITFIDKTFDPSVAAQVAQNAKEMNPSGKKAPASIASETGGGQTVSSQNVQQNVQATVSPSAP